MNPNPYVNEDMQALAETVRRFAREKVEPGFLVRDKSRELDRLLLREMGELGFICPEVPEAFGGLGMGCLAAGVPTKPQRAKAQKGESKDTEQLDLPTTN